ncbi:HAD-IC family P-type ATPase [Methylocystis sp. IM4]|uniref:HAD-IC family P-type ATPase n=1 Tax=Methylocystis sp. IM4 TaxID=3136560 RepID=UPI0031197599
MGLDTVYYEQQPEDKARIIATLKQQGCPVAYVGDGVNDGPALMEAHVGVSMPRAADIARATADIVLLNDRLDGFAEILSLSQNTLRLIRSNFGAAVGVNSAILVGAASGNLPPVASAVLHNGATIAVLLRAPFAVR